MCCRYFHFVIFESRPSSFTNHWACNSISRVTRFPMKTFRSANRRQPAKVSQLVPKHSWDATKVASCMGQFLQVRCSDAFLSVVGLATLLCWVLVSHQHLCQHQNAEMMMMMMMMMMNGEKADAEEQWSLIHLISVI